MKRSEMLEKIDIIVLRGLKACFEKDEEFAFGEHILKTIEEAGMLPPAYPTRLDNGLEVRMMEWEEEDDS